jgi:hypothetical protein
MLEKLEVYAENEYKKNNITIFQGEDGLKQWNLSRLQPRTKIIREISQRSSLQPFFSNRKDYDDYMIFYIKRRVSLKKQIRVLVGQKDSKDIYDITSGADLKETRILPSFFDPRAAVSTWADITGFISFKEGNPLAVSIRDEFVTAVMNSMYDTIWEMCIPKPEDKKHSVHKK